MASDRNRVVLEVTVPVVVRYGTPADLRTAKSLLRGEDAPYTSVIGTNGNGWYGIQSKRPCRIVARPSRKAKS